jgi:aminoglycoside phosphotransferase (APT) family kinase protein
VRVLEIGTGDAWEAAYAAPAADVVTGWERWTAGDALVHRDIRLDNTAVDADGRSAVLLDWAYAAAGAPGSTSPNWRRTWSPPDTPLVSKRRRIALIGCCGRCRRRHPVSSWG